MKRKFWVYALSLALAVSAVFGFTAALAADAPTEAMSIQSVQSTNIAGGWGEGLAVIPVLADESNVEMDYRSALDGSKIAIRDPYGEAVTVQLVETFGTQFAINRTKGYPPKGSIITFQEGFYLQETASKAVYGGILKSDQSFIYLEGQYGVWDAFLPAESLTLDAAAATVQVGGETHPIVATVTGTTNAYLTYKSADESVAKVSASGEVTGVAEGSTTITVTSGFFQETLTVTVEAPAVAQTGIRVTNADKKISTYVGEDYDLSELSVVAVYGDKDGAAVTVTKEMISGTVKKDTVGEYQLTVTSGTFTDTFTVAVVARPAMTIKAINYDGTWKGISLSFVEDIITGEHVTGTGVKVEGIAIRHRDGTLQEVTNVGILGDQLLIGQQSGHAEGDIVTIEKGFRIISRYDDTFAYDHELKEDVSYVCTEDGKPYEVYTAPTEFSVTPATAEAQVAGATAELTATVKGGNGLLTFVTEDRNIARVTAGETTTGEDGAKVTKATVTGASEGEVTIKIVCGFSEKTVKVTVKPAAEQPNGIRVTTENKKIVTYQGYEYDLAELKAVYTYQSGAEGAEIDITAKMVTGSFDKETVGSYTLTLTVDDFTDDFTVQVIAVPLYGIQISGGKTEPTPGGDFGNNSGWGDFYFVTDLDGKSLYFSLPAEQLASVKSHFYLNGKNDVLAGCKYFGLPRYEFYLSEAAKGALVPGDVIKLAKGMPMWSYTGTSTSGHQLKDDGKIILLGELKEDLTFLYTGKGWVVYKESLLPTDFTFSSSVEELPLGVELVLDYKMVPATAYGTPVFTSSDPTIAKVDFKGRVVALKEGKVTITAKMGDKTHTVDLTVVAAKEVKGIELADAYESYWIVKDSKGEDFKPSFKQARLVFADDSVGPVFSLAAGSYKIETLLTDKVGEGRLKVTVTYEDKDYETYIKINIYEYYDQIVSQVAIVDWFEYAVFVQFPNTSTNDVNLTDPSMTKGIKGKVHYARKDGTEVELGYYILKDNLALLPDFLTGEDGKHQVNKDNYNEFYLEGDRITIDAGMPMYKWTGRKLSSDTDTSKLEPGTGESVVEGYVKKTVQYVYNGSIWSLYIEYTDIEAGSPEMTLKINEKKSAGVYRVPDDATTGTFRYESSDPSVVTVSPTGVLQGKKAGTASVKVTLSGGEAGDKSVTIQVTVVDYVLDKLALEPLTLESVPYADALDLSNVKAYLQWASGKRGEEVSLEGATVAGFNKDAEGEQTVTVSVTVDGKTYVGVLTIASVEKPGRGCGGAADGACGVLFSGVLLIAGALALVKRRTRG